MATKTSRDLAARYSLTIAHQAVRNNTIIEALHSGTSPHSEVGDHCDVKVVTSHGEIKWSELSRISNEEMKTLMIEIVDNVYSIMCLLLDGDPAVSIAENFAHIGTSEWKRPSQNRKLVEAYRQLQCLTENKIK